MSRTVRPFLLALAALAASLPTRGGEVRRAFYDNFGTGAPGAGIDDLVNAQDFERSGGFAPQTLNQSLDTAAQNANDADAPFDAFGSLIRGYIVAPATGAFTFALAADDAAEFYLNTDAASHEVFAFRDPNRLVAQADAPTADDLFDGPTAAQRSGAAALERGKAYYFELLHKESSGDSFARLGWRRPDGVQEVIPATALQPWGRPDDHTRPATAVLVAAPPASTTVQAADSVTFSVTAFGPPPLSFQWLKDGVPIDGAILGRLILEDIDAADAGDYSVEVASASGPQATSAAATLTVEPLEPQFFQLEGQSRYYSNNEGVPDVRLSVQEDQAVRQLNASPEGAFVVQVAAQQAVTLSPNIDTNEAASRAVDVSDIIDLRKHILATERLPTPHAVLAADVNRDRSVDIVDVTQIRRVILGLQNSYSGPEGAPDPIWRILASDLVFPDLLQPWNALAEDGSSEQRAYATVDQDWAEQDFIALKLGDVNGSWTPSLDAQASRLPQPDSRSLATATDPTRWATRQAVLSLKVRASKDRRVRAQITVRGAEPLVGLQAGLIWNPQEVRLIDVSGSELRGFDDDAHTARRLGTLRAVWTDPSISGQPIHEETVVVALTFDRLTAPDATTGVRFDNAVLPIRIETRQSRAAEKRHAAPLATSVNAPARRDRRFPADAATAASEAD